MAFSLISTKNRKRLVLPASSLPPYTTLPHSPTCEGHHEAEEVVEAYPESAVCTSMFMLLGNAALLAHTVIIKLTRRQEGGIGEVEIEEIV
jgi:hypothetical protein